MAHLAVLVAAQEEMMYRLLAVRARPIKDMPVETTLLDQVLLPQAVEVLAALV